MKTIKRILLVASMLGIASPLQAKISQKLDQRLDAMITRLHQAKGFDDYKSEDFLADVKKR